VHLLGVPQAAVSAIRAAQKQNSAHHTYLWCKDANKQSTLQHLSDHSLVIPYQALIEPVQQFLICLQRCSQESLH